ncbi:hypothetical protein ACFTWD_09395 [Streptomyces sp. NPDC056943]|uniref:hypothetical protein n=1 Tax=Streptomyces sp. NPDC056943 TaxID=3345971 RepID=UPI00362B865C
MTQPTTRVRLYGGRNTHAARPGRTGTGHVTPCNYPVGRNDHWLPDDEPVTCPTCKRILAKTGDTR